MNIIIAILVGIVAGFCLREFWPKRSPADGGPDVDDCLEIMETCTAALHELDRVGLISDLSPEAYNSRMHVEQTIATAAQRLQMICTTEVYIQGVIHVHD